jgi:bifunctional DNA-binding transcriptional regulator/antitoxin component of YhaV-PrlF toxin-antitoxin module
MTAIPLENSGKMEEIHLKIDSKGRICIPQEIREQIGQTATMKKTKEGFTIVPGKPIDFLDEFRQVISSEPKRKGKPKLATPQQMKSIWRIHG